MEENRQRNPERKIEEMEQDEEAVAQSAKTTVIKQSRPCN